MNEALHRFNKEEHRGNSDRGQQLNGQESIDFPDEGQADLFISIHHIVAVSKVILE